MKRLIIFDLDDTLLHASRKPFDLAQLQTESFYIAVRPGITKMLERLSPHYDFVIWSNTDRASIDEKIADVWPKHIPLVDIFCDKNSSMRHKEGQGEHFFKEVWKVIKRHPQYTLGMVLGIEDKPETFARNYGNVIRVSPFSGTPDRELDDLTDYLLSIATHPNYRALEKRHWKADLRRARYYQDDETPSR